MLNKLINIVSFKQTILARFTILFSLTIIFTLSLFTVCFPATSLLRQHQESPNVLRYHAQDSLKDRDGNTWQVLLFPEDLSTSSPKYYLRLVGFPGVNSFVHPQSLEILTSQGKILTARDVYSIAAPAPNVGQYDLSPIMTKLPSKGSLKLSVTLQNSRELALKIAPEVLSEWQLLIQEIEPGKL